MHNMKALLSNDQRAADYHPANQRIILALRIAVMQTHNRKNPLETMANVLGSAKAASALVHVLRMIGEYWPEPVIVQPPCCPMVSMDEKLMIDLITAAVQDNRPDYDRMLCEMVDEDVRHHIYNAIQAFILPYIAGRVSAH